MPSQRSGGSDLKERLQRVIEQAHATIDDPQGAYYIPLDEDSGYQVQISKVER
ncbi:hypothetical protein HSR121_0803 [Halapricum desulfuricans]|uniref:Uncharacterized protein n=1 Tax=Halapricum desulfuricans TaxID=2841257 RepID=A0A897MXI7_9EURY|nr:hypothetical protein HSR121_0803 [Halapricum desulfuricans]